ncbi:MAG: hypothetical protein DMD40_01980 [Gemmatimonadetes bacterium]|nr:MAG: hypothetical protein DMD40_01980 [Gemmatimonadota bacterium]
MIESLATRDRRALTVGVVTIGALILGFRGVPAWLRWRMDVRASAAEAIAQERRVHAVVAGFSQSLDSLGARAGRFRSMGPAFLTGATPAEAAATLAALVGEIARSSLVRIDALELHVDSATAGYDMPRVRLDAQATADVAGLAALVRNLEKGPTLLAVRRLSVRPQSVESPANQVEALAIQFNLEGLVLLSQQKAQR